MYEIDGIKLNSNCPASEKTGEGPGSCGGGKEGESTEKKSGIMSRLFGGKKKESAPVESVPKLKVHDNASAEALDDNSLDKEIQKFTKEVENMPEGSNRNDAISSLKILTRVGNKRFKVESSRPSLSKESADKNKDMREERRSARRMSGQ